MVSHASSAARVVISHFNVNMGRASYMQSCIRLFVCCLWRRRLLQKWAERASGKRRIRRVVMGVVLDAMNSRIGRVPYEMASLRSQRLCSPL